MDSAGADRGRDPPPTELRHSPRSANEYCRLQGWVDEAVRLFCGPAEGRRTWHYQGRTSVRPPRRRPFSTRCAARSRPENSSPGSSWCRT
jgi:hypothetical protein